MGGWEVKYTGILYGKVAGKYIPTEETSATVDARDTRIAELEARVKDLKEKYYRAYKDFQGIPCERCAELEAALDGIIGILEDNYRVKAIQRARDALAKETDNGDVQKTR